MAADYVFVRPNGKPYRPRTTELRARAWENHGGFAEDCAGVIVLGTLNVEEARPLAQSSAEAWYGDADTFRLIEPASGWWRDSFTAEGRAWIPDGERGAPGVMFTWAETATAPKES